MRKEPALIIGLVVTILAIIQELLVDGFQVPDDMWAALPLVTGAIVRFTVYAPDTVHREYPSAKLNAP